VVSGTVSSLLREVIPLALAAAISPVIFLLQLNTLTGDRPVARGAALTAGAAIVLIVVSTIGVLVGDTGFSTNDTLKAGINIAFGVLLVAVGLRALVRPPRPKAPTTADAKPSSIGRSFLAGAGGMASNLTTFALYTSALALIAGSGLLLRQQGLAALTILLITLMVAWVPLVLAAVVPGASTRLLPRLGGWMTANNRWIQVVLGFGFGIWLLVKGVNGL
jgi:threonine/homoserine/homoserine lactone efflux protein